jgi:hypothetical protein
MLQPSLPPSWTLVYFVHYYHYHFHSGSFPNPSLLVQGLVFVLRPLAVYLVELVA